MAKVHAFKRESSIAYGVTGLPEPTTTYSNEFSRFFIAARKQGRSPSNNQGNGNPQKQYPHRTPHPRAAEGRPAQRKLAGTRDWLLAQPSLQGVPQAFVGWRTAAPHFLGHEFQLFPILHGGVYRRDEGQVG